MPVISVKDHCNEEQKTSLNKKSIFPWFKDEVNESVTVSRAFICREEDTDLPPTSRSGLCHRRRKWRQGKKTLRRNVFYLTPEVRSLKADGSVC